ncbi:MAG: transporter substrate-binding domain-containing protein [Dysgonamonadaceae bacterium]|jgi:membrane-bound lytic murein transglycosylase MltF|nr:transporter substrate-binding domain-containing protein [Dysgonamonadaceae bacterium]
MMTTDRKTIVVRISIFLALLLLAGFVTIQWSKRIPPRDFPDIASSGVLKVATEYNSVGYYVSGDSIAGTQSDLCRYIESRSGLKVNIALENNLETCINKLQDNIYDVIAINIPITNEIRKEVAFTVPITQNKQVLVQRKPGKNDSLPLIRNQMHLARRTILVPKHSPGILRLQNLSEEIAEPIYIREVEDYTQEQLLYMVAYGKADYALLDKAIAMKNSKLFPEIDVQTDISFPQLQAWAVRKNSPVLLDSLNKWITDCRRLK